MNETATNLIYYAEDRNYPLNQMHQDIVDKWLNDDEGTKGILEYELCVIEMRKEE